MPPAIPPSVKIFPNEAFGFLRITVERPLRLRWEVTDETRRGAVRADKTWGRSRRTDQNSIIADLGHSIGPSATDEALRDLARTALKRAGLKGKPIRERHRRARSPCATPTPTR
jgi:type I restriction enzyme M protein